MVTIEEKQALFAEMDKLFTGVESLMVYVMSGEPLDEDDAPENLSEIMEENEKKFLEGMDLFAKEIVNLSQGGMGYELSERVAFTYMKAATEVLVKNNEAFMQQALEMGYDAFMEIYEDDMPELNAKNEKEGLALFSEQAAKEGFTSEQVEVAVKAARLQAQ